MNRPAPKFSFLLGTESLLIRCGEALGPLAVPNTKTEGCSLGLSCHPSYVQIRSATRVAPASFRAPAAHFIALALAAYFCRLTDQSIVVVGPVDSAVAGGGSAFDPRPFPGIEVAPDQPFAALVERFSALREGTSERSPDQLSAGALEWVVINIADGLESTAPPGNAALGVVVSHDGTKVRWVCDSGTVPEVVVRRLADGFEAFYTGLDREPTKAVREQPVISEDEYQRSIVDWNATTRAFPQLCIHQLFQEQVARTPNATAVAFASRELSYRELDLRSNRLAHHLRGKGVGPGVRVGLCVNRSVEMVVALLGILKAGGAYVPLDPAYPHERLALMSEDAAIVVLVTESGPRDALGLHAPHVVCLDLDAAAIAAEPGDPVPNSTTPEDIAYTLYTSGSTGKPKGVMVRHRNVVNFFTGMDEHLGPERGTWLAVTSLSFDISVLELLWTLCRGFKVLLHSERSSGVIDSPDETGKKLDLSLMFFASGQGAETGALDQYRLLLEATKFGDRNGFAAVWTPERHFHAFGGLYPNPSVVAAALATITERIKIRAGSVVAPLHHPLRIAEEWALVDNLSHGRVGVSFAAGWQPIDFVLRPEAFADRKEEMFRVIDMVRRLWRGEAVKLPSPLGGETEVRTLPRPIQPELPFWLTAAANPETFAAAGRLGANVLTHLLGQTVAEVGEKVAVYRKAWAEAGHPGRGTVTLMLHTFLGTDENEVRETVRQPMKEYLRSAVSLVKAAAWTFPTTKLKTATSGRTLAEAIEQKGLSEEDMDALLDHAFDRYYRTSGLLGTPESCLEMLLSVRVIGVDEVACLLDFGVPSDKVLAQLPLLLALKERVDARRSQPGAEASVAGLIRIHSATHLQCTPSLAKILVADPDARSALSALRFVLLGGEALPRELLRELGEVPNRAILNMYGPTETTVWSTTARVDGLSGPVPIGRPLANTQVYILDSHLRPVPIGVPGELCIGGEGVAAGYLNRPELTAERFPLDPFASCSSARMYRTGDLARFREDGTLEFLGRLDHQVKIRGHRIEPGEIESVLRRHPAVKDAVVTSPPGEDGSRLVGYLIPTNGELPNSDALRAYLSGELPDYMIPAAFVTLAAFPLTPNGKIDRKALPVPGSDRPELEARYVPPRTAIEKRLVAVWEEALGLERVGIEDEFLRLGGDSLSAIRLILGVRNAFGVEVPLQRLFQAPTIAALARVIEELTGEGEKLETIPQRDHSRPCPLSPAQERIWFLEQLLPGLRAYHETEAYRIRGPLDVKRLEEAFNVVVARHDALRTLIRTIDDTPMQVVVESVTVNIAINDLSDLPPERKSAEVDRLLKEEPQRLFDFGAQPALRVTLARLGKEDHVLLMLQHFMFCDRWSLNVLYRELGAVYQALARGQPSSLPELPIQYGDFAAWQRRQDETGAFEDDLVFWTARLRNAPPALELPIARARPEVFSYQGNLKAFPLGTDVTENIHAFTRQEGFSPFTVLTAVVNVLLARYAGQDDIVLGLPIANRDRPELTSLYGLLIDFQALRTDLSGNPTFRELLGRIHQGVLDVQAHRGVPFNKVIEALKPNRDLSRSPIFQVMLSWRDRNAQRDFRAFEDLEVSYLPAHAGGCATDLTLILNDVGREIVLEVEYSTDLFDVDAIERFVECFRTLLNAALANPQEQLSALPLLTAADRERVLVNWNATRAEYPRDACIHELFEEQVKLTPKRVAVVYEGRPATYAELNNRAEQLAQRLRALGVRPGVFVGIFMDRSPEMLVALLGTLKAGGAYVPLDPLFPQARLAMMVEESRPLVILTQTFLRDDLPAHSSEIICLDRLAPAVPTSGQSNARPQATSLAYLLYTSGSTGRPKGVQVNHRAVVNLLTSMRSEPGLVPNDILLSVTTLSFDIAALELFLPLITGACVVLAGREVATDGVRLAELLATSGATVMQATPSRWKMLVQAGWKGNPKLKILCGGEALSRELADQLLARCGTLWNVYGPTETTIWSTVCQVCTGESITIGRPIANTQTHVLDTHLQPVPVGVPGELYIGGDGLSEGYLNRPELNAQRFVPDPFRSDPGARLFRTGDLARYRPDGSLECLGRLDHQVKVRGYRIELEEIENVLGRYPGVLDRAVVVREGADGENVLAAYVVPASGAVLEKGALGAFLKDQLPDYMIPSVFVSMDRLPLTPNGKLDRQTLPAPTRNPSETAERYIAPRTPVETRLQQIWSKLLNQDQPSVVDNFFELGGHSLIAVRLVAQIQSEFGVRLHLASIFERATIEKMAAAIESAPRPIPVGVSATTRPDKAPLSSSPAGTNNGDVKHGAPVASFGKNGSAADRVGATDTYPIDFTETAAHTPAELNGVKRAKPPESKRNGAPAPGWYRFLSVSDHWTARMVRSVKRTAQNFSVPVPGKLLVPVLYIYISIRSIYYFCARTMICEPLFKAYCTRYGKNLHTGTFLHWIQGKGTIILGDNVTIDGKCSFTFAARFVDRPVLQIGSNTGVGHGCRFVVGKSITIGSHCRIAGGTHIFDSGGHPKDVHRRARGESPDSEDVLPVVIHDHVWIGMDVTIYPGVTIGEGAIIGAGSVVMSDVDPYTVVAGNPAGKIGEARPQQVPAAAPTP